MAPELKQKWLDALKSGNFTHTIAQLKVTDPNKYEGRRVGHCCLGVLAEIAGMKISENGYNIVDDQGNNIDYQPFHDMGIRCSTLFNINDTSRDGYAPAIAWIEKNL